MTLGEVLAEVWKQVLVDRKPGIELDSGTYPVDLTPSKRLRTVAFTWEGHAITGIEQNPRTGSRWAKLAQSGSRIMQFSYRGRFIANVCDGGLTCYPAWKAEGLPE